MVSAVAVADTEGEESGPASMRRTEWVIAPETGDEIRAAGIATALAALEQSVNRASLPVPALNAITKALEKMEECDARGEGFNRAGSSPRV